MSTPEAGSLALLTPEQRAKLDQLGYDVESLDAKIKAAAVSRPPRHIPGQQTVCYSPMQYFALTRASSQEPDVISASLGHTEQPLETIAKDGIRLGGELYTAPDLQMIIQSDKGLPQRRLVIRYDRSRLARGTLKEVHVWERNGKDSYRFLLTCGPAAEVMEQIDVNRLIRERERYLNALLAERTMAEVEHVSLAAGTRAAEQLLRDTAARQKHQKRTKPKAHPVVPIGSDAAQREDEERHGIATELQSAGGLPDRPRNEDSFAEASQDALTPNNLPSGGIAGAVSGRARSGPR
jgi:hypothetical protein